MHIEWGFIIILIALFVALIREVVKAEHRVSDLATENQVLLLKVESLERSYAASARQLKQQSAKIERVQLAVKEMEQHPESVVVNLCRLGVYMQQFFTTDDYFDLNTNGE